MGNHLIFRSNDVRCNLQMTDENYDLAAVVKSANNCGQGIQ